MENKSDQTKYAQMLYEEYKTLIDAGFSKEQAFCVFMADHNAELECIFDNFD